MFIVINRVKSSKFIIETEKEEFFVSVKAVRQTAHLTSKGTIDVGQVTRQSNKNLVVGTEGQTADNCFRDVKNRRI